MQRHVLALLAGPLPALQQKFVNVLVQLANANDQAAVAVAAGQPVPPLVRQRQLLLTLKSQQLHAAVAIRQQPALNPAQRLLAMQHYVHQQQVQFQQNLQQRQQLLQQQQVLQMLAFQHSSSSSARPSPPT